jgi:prophage DNA circulation protein
MAFPAIPAALAGVLGMGSSGGTWEDRLQSAAYTSPSGTKIYFDFEDVSRVVSKRGTVWEFTDVNGGYVQDTGHGPRQYPLRCYFSGNKCDLIATAFEAALLEKGTGQLDHPLYGSFPAVPFGDIARRDDLKNAANQVVVEVTFFTTITNIYPSGQGDPLDEVLLALDGFDVAAAQQLADSTNLATVASKANAVASIRKLLKLVSSALTAASDATASVNREFRSAQSTVNYGLDVLIGQPLQLGLQLSNLITAPARALAGIESRLTGYANLAQSIFSSSAAAGALSGITLGSLRARLTNDARIADHFAMASVAGAVLSVTRNKFTTRPDAISAAASVMDHFDAVVAWRESIFGALDQVDTGESYQALQSAVSLVAGYLVEISFVLLPERRIVLDRARTIIDLASEIYGSVDDRLDFLIDSNGLSGSEILELPRGRSIVYYP